jgi:hypothetical protein
VQREADTARILPSNPRPAPFILAAAVVQPIFVPFSLFFNNKSVLRCHGEELAREVWRPRPSEEIVGACAEYLLLWSKGCESSAALGAAAAALVAAAKRVSGDETEMWLCVEERKGLYPKRVQAAEEQRAARPYPGLNSGKC